MLVCSRHQIQGCELRDVGLRRPDGNDFVMSSESWTSRKGTHTQDSDAYDIVAFDFSKPVTDNLIPGESFFKFEQVPADTFNSNILAFIVAGYPSGKQKYELYDKNHLGTFRYILTAQPDGQPEDQALLKLKFIQDLDFDPDGLSGGPAFVVQRVGSEPRVFLGGMIIRSGKSHCYILKSGFLWEFLNSFS